MLKNLFKLIFILIFGTNLYSLSETQVKNLQISYSIGKQIKMENGTTLENTLCSILLAESSAGLEIIGDKYENGKLKSVYDSSLGAFQIRLITAKEVIKKDKFMNTHFKHLLKNDKGLVNLLLMNVQFSAMIAGTYLKINYNRALKKHMKNPWRKSISKYNGGWNNTTYIKRVLKRYKNLKNYKKRYRIDKS